ncbi:MAG: asparaginase domain-containing protein [Pseudomonadota bacterium]
MFLMKIKIFTTGGTIDKIYFDRKSEYQIGDPQAGVVLARANVIIEYEVEPILWKDSLDLMDADRNLIKQKVYDDPCNRILITHGTDTMIRTAKALGKDSGKTIVLTGSMYPAEFRDSDAIFNIGCAIIAVQILGPGVYIAMNGRIFDPYCSEKNIEKNRFEERQ